jgi:hypothetical protein
MITAALANPSVKTTNVANTNKKFNLTNFILL